MVEIKKFFSTTCLLTLTGAGGSGKTRLALQVANDLLEGYPDGVWLTHLAQLAEPALVPKAVASALGIPEQPSRPLTETVIDYLRPKAALLLLDNCEHLLQACGQVADALLQACPKLRILATSREALGIAGELSFRVPSLSLPDLHHLPPPETLTKYEAVRLFVERAAFAKPGFQITDTNAGAVAQITHRLDGIPLAIELAAARVKALPVDVLAERLADRFRLLTGGSRASPPRHQTLQAALDWSYDLLSEQERILLRRLSVFAGRFSLGAAEKICAGGGVDENDVLDLLARLVDKSLVVFDDQDGQARYWLLETMHQYGFERLVESGEADDVRRRHRDWFLALAERAGPKVIGPEQEVWVEHLRGEYDNIRVALEWSMGGGDAESGLRLATALSWFWYVDGYWSEARKWLEQALALGGHVSIVIQQNALLQAAYHARSQGDYEKAKAFAEKGLRLARETNNKANIAWFLLDLGIVAVHEGDYSRGKTLCEESIALGRDLGLNDFLAWSLAQLGHIARDSADYEQATTFYGESLAFARKFGEKYLIAYALRNDGVLKLHIGDYERAATLFTESLALYRTGGANWVTEECLVGMAEIAYAKRRYERAACLFGAADTLRDFLGVRPSPRIKDRYDKSVLSTRAALGESAFAAPWAKGQAMTTRQAIEYALEDD
jgi:non-specific serine/threonine protein kinase